MRPTYTHCLTLVGLLTLVGPTARAEFIAGAGLRLQAYVLTPHGQGGFETRETDLVAPNHPLGPLEVVNYASDPDSIPSGSMTATGRVRSMPTPPIRYASHWKIASLNISNLP